MVSNWPVAQATSYRNIEVTMIQAMRNSPNTTPWAAAAPTSDPGIPKPKRASSTAATNPASADCQTGRRSPTSITNRITTGSAASNVDSGQAPVGS